MRPCSKSVTARSRISRGCSAVVCPNAAIHSEKRTRKAVIAFANSIGQARAASNVQRFRQAREADRGSPGRAADETRRRNRSVRRSLAFLFIRGFPVRSIQYTYARVIRGHKTAIL